MWAQYALETGRGKHCFSWNLGNRKARAGETFTVLTTDEGYGPTKRTIVDKFAAFASLDAGMADWIAFLSQLPRYAHSWAALLSGDPIAYAHALARGGYYTGDPQAYAHGLASLQAEFLRLHLDSVQDIPTRPDPHPPEWMPQTSAATVLPGIVPPTDMEG
jgi:flagellum-specific peptidoglycan hydrolase FlgJ